MKKRNPGGGRSLKYGEATVSFPVRCPKSRAYELKLLIANFLTECIQSPRSPTAPP